MVKRKIDAVIMESVNDYIEVIKQHYNLDAVYLFGSHAKGNTHKSSDVDLAIVSNDIQNRHDDMVNLLVLAKDIEADIEPHPFKTEEFNENGSSFVHEILRTGIPVYPNS